MLITLIGMIQKMTVQIRLNTFETNSSSMHSIVISKTEGYYTPDEIKDEIWINNGVWDINRLDFGRSPFELITTFTGKVRYAIAEFCGSYIDQDRAAIKFKQIEDIVFKACPDIKEIDLPIGSWHSQNYDDIDYGYIDHESAGLLTNFLNKKQISLEEFLTKKAYWIVIDGDEYYIWDHMKEVRAIDKNMIVYDTQDDYSKDSPEPDEGMSCNKYGKKEE